MLQICVVGWHFRREFYESLRTVAGRFDIVVVANRAGDSRGLRTVERENTGLDWGAFSYFLDHEWKPGASVLFLHDDTEAGDAFWLDVEQIDYDQAFIFRDPGEFEHAYSHGRAHFASARFLTLVGDRGGIWFDSGNRGFVATGYSWSEPPPPACLDHNAGARAYTELVKEIAAERPELVVDRQVYSGHVRLGRRGWIDPQV